MIALAAVSLGLAAVGSALALAGWAVVARQARRAPSGRLVPARPPVTVLKPLCGDEPLLEQALATVCGQDYPAFQIVFGVQDPADPALAVVRRLQSRFPDCDIGVVIDPTQHGRNRKVGNLMNMLRAARHPVLVIADGDVHVPADWLDRLVAALGRPGTGLATALYTGLPANPSLAARLGATQITHTFLPGALLAQAFGRQDCFGASMAIRRETLDRIGGFRILVEHLADDNVLGRLVRAEGLGIALAPVVPATTVPESTLVALWTHELRWGRTIRALAPIGFTLATIQYPLLWAAVSVALAGGATWSIGAFLLAWAARALTGRGIDRALGLAIPAPVWLLPLRDLLSFAVVVASFLGDRVEWRGHALAADHGRNPAGEAGDYPVEDAARPP